MFVHVHFLDCIAWNTQSLHLGLRPPALQVLSCFFLIIRLITDLFEKTNFTFARIPFLLSNHMTRTIYQNTSEMTLLIRLSQVS